MTKCRLFEAICILSVELIVQLIFRLENKIMFSEIKRKVRIII